MLSFCEIKEFSENFKYPIGPKMFKGMLPHIDNQPVAIKELDTTTEQRKFRGAVSKVGNIHHKNLTKQKVIAVSSVTDTLSMNLPKMVLLTDI